MDEIASAEFRRTYAKLRKPTFVTANGHVIGQWIPARTTTQAAELRLVADEDVIDHALGTPGTQRAAAQRIAQGRPSTTVIHGTGSFAEFRPVPKPGRKR